MTKIVNYIPEYLKANKVCRRFYRAFNYCINFKPSFLSRMVCDICDKKMHVFERSLNKIWMQCPECMIIRVNVLRRERILLMRGESNGGRGPHILRNLHKREGYFVDLFRNKFGINDILLYGIGWSPLFGELKDLGLNVIGCDLYKELVNFRNEEYQQEVFFHPNDLPDYKFDVITAFEVFEHFIEPFKNLTFLSYHLKEKGGICGCTNFWQENERLCDPVDDHPYWGGGHVCAWNKKAMRGAAHKLGMKVRYFKSDYVGWENKVFFLLYKGDDIDDYVQSFPDVLPIKKEGDIE